MLFLLHILDILNVYMKIHLATDHAGFLLKEQVKGYLETSGHIVHDFGALTHVEGDDYAPYIAEAARKVQHDAMHDPSIAIIFGGSGQGEAIVANRYRHVRAIVYAGGDLSLVRLGRLHNDANVLSLGARFVSFEEAKAAIEVFLTTTFSHEERHSDRVIMIDEITK